MIEETEETEGTENYGVTVRCNKCGNEICFHPLTVLVNPTCSKCGNDDTGDPVRDWPQDKFGSFTLVNRYVLRLPSIDDLLDKWQGR